MATYRFRVTFEDYDDVVRDIEIRSTQTFEDLHYAIQNAIGFDAAKAASFYMSDDNWKKGKEISTREVKDESKVISVKTARLCDFIIDPHQKIYYISDPSTQWSFRIELVKINREEDPSVAYPRCIKSTGDAPKQYQTTTAAVLPVPEDFDMLALDEETDEDEGEESDLLVVEESDLPEGEEKDTFIKSDFDDSAGEDFEPAEGDAADDESVQEKDDF